MVEIYWGSGAVVDLGRSAVDFRSFDKACVLKDNVDDEEGRFRSYICQRLRAVARWSCVHVGRLAVVVVWIVVIAMSAPIQGLLIVAKVPPHRRCTATSWKVCATRIVPLPLFIKVPIQLPGEWSSQDAVEMLADGDYLGSERGLGL
jgi:hypothetical protein